MAEFVSASLGAVLGGLTMVLWNAAGRRLGNSQFWTSFERLARGMISGEAHQAFFRQYAQLLRLLAIHFWKMACRVCVAIVPVVLTLTLLAPVAARHAWRRADHLEVYPPQSLAMVTAKQLLTFGSDGKCELPQDVLHAPIRILIDGLSVDVPRFEGAVAISTSPWKFLGLQLLGLDTYKIAHGPSVLIVRPSDGNKYPLWPFFNKLEIVFWIGMLFSSAGIGILLGVIRR